MNKSDHNSGKAVIATFMFRFLQTTGSSSLSVKSVAQLQKFSAEKNWCKCAAWKSGNEAQKNYENLLFICLAPRVPRGSLISYERQLVFYDSCTFRLLLHLLSSHTKFQVIFEPFSPWVMVSGKGWCSILPLFTCGPWHESRVNNKTGLIMRRRKLGG